MASSWPSFDLASPAGIQAALLALDTSLRIEARAVVLGSHIVQRGVIVLSEQIDTGGTEMH